MVRIERKTTVLNRPWDQLAEAINQKYPNPHSNSARSNDVLKRYIDGENRLITEKWIGNDFPVPSIIRSTFLTCTGIDFPSTAFNYQLDVINKNEGVFRQYSRNNTMSSFLNFVEVMEYTKIDESQTLLTQTFHVGCTINTWFDGWFEGQLISTCLNNSKKGLIGLEWVAEKLNSGRDGLLDLNVFREGLKEFYYDCEQLVSDASDKIKEHFPNHISETTGEISRAVNQLYEKEQSRLQESFDDIKKTTIETTEEIVGTAEELASTVVTDIKELKMEGVKNVTKRIRFISENIAIDNVVKRE